MLRTPGEKEGGGLVAGRRGCTCLGGSESHPQPHPERCAVISFVNWVFNEIPLEGELCDLNTQIKGKN